MPCRKRRAAHPLPHLQAMVVCGGGVACSAVISADFGLCLAHPIEECERVKAFKDELTKCKAQVKEVEETLEVRRSDAAWEVVGSR